MKETCRALRPRSLVFFHDVLMVPIAWLGAYWLRFNLSPIPDWGLYFSLNYLPLVILIQALIFRFCRLYRGSWRFVSTGDLLRISKTVAIGTLLIAVALFLYNRLEGVPRSVIPLYAILLFILLNAPRFLYRIYADRVGINKSGQRALIVGAGQAGEMLVRDLLRCRDSAYFPVAFVDDDPKKRGWEVHGLRVMGSCDKIPRLVQKLSIEVILLAVPSAKDKEMRRTVEICEACEVPFLTLPSLKEILTRPVTQQTLRDVSIEDLLGRDPVQLEKEHIRAHLTGKTILVTGGGGSIGSELCKQIACYPIARLIIFERCEFNLFRVSTELAKQFPAVQIKPVLGDVTDSVAVERVLAEHAPQIIFHAAAYKHVPLLQGQVRVAALNNVLGTQVVAEAAIVAGVQEFILISTDKAVNPSNIMGATKRVAEILCQTFNQTAGTRFVTVRFGNVLDSVGSVVPLFREQIKAGGPVTVTHPAIIRYFMTIPEACQLIMQAAAVGQGGEVFVLDMGEPVKISYLAEQMIRLSGKRPGKDIKIEYIGLRPGEKMYEELFHEKERPAATGHSKLLLARSRHYDLSTVKTHLNALQSACAAFDERRILEIMHSLVPEFRSLDQPLEQPLPNEVPKKKDLYLVKTVG